MYSGQAKPNLVAWAMGPNLCLTPSTLSQHKPQARITISNRPLAMPRTSEKRQFENEIAPTMEVATFRPRPRAWGNRKRLSYYDLLSAVDLVHHATSDSSIAAVKALRVEETISEYLRYPDRNFVIDFRIHRESFRALVELLHERLG